jgi:hypothetical protein
LIEVENDVDAKVTGQGAKPNGDVGFEEKVDGDPDCEVLRVERATRTKPEHKTGERAGGLVQVPLGLTCKNKLESNPASTTV